MKIKIMMITGLLMCGSCVREIIPINITRQQNRYIDSICNLPDLNKKVKEHSNQLSSYKKQLDREKETRKRELNKVITRNN